MITPITALIVNDHEVVRQGLQAYLVALPDNDIVGEADSGEAAVSEARECIPDVVHTDLVMEGLTVWKPSAW